MFSLKIKTCSRCYLFQVGRKGLEKPSETSGPCAFHDRTVLHVEKAGPPLIVRAQDLCIYQINLDELISNLTEEEVASRLNENQQKLRERLESSDIYLKGIDPIVLDKIKRRLPLKVLNCRDCLLYNEHSERPHKGQHKQLTGRCNLFDSVNTSKRDLCYSTVFSSQGCRYGLREGYYFGNLTPERIAIIANKHKQFFQGPVSKDDVNVTFLFPEF